MDEEEILQRREAMNARELGRRAVLVALGLLALACGQVVVDDPEPLSIDLTAERTEALVSDSVTFEFEAVGDQLARVVLLFGDGQADTVGTFGARSASGRRAHTYQEPGSFLVTGRVTDVAGAVATDELTVEILPRE